MKDFLELPFRFWSDIFRQSVRDLPSTLRRNKLDEYKAQYPEEFDKDGNWIGWK